MIKKIKSLGLSVLNKFKNKTKFQKLLIITVAVTVVFIANGQLNKEEEGPTYKFGQVSRGNIIEQVSETGSITTSNKVEINSTIDGVVTEVYVENGAEVKRGDKLFYVVSSATEAERSKAYSSYLSAKNSLESAKANLNSLESKMWAAHEDFEARALDTELSVDDPIFIQTERDWHASEANYLNQKDVISQGQAAVSSSWLAYQATADGPVKATIDGQVVNLALAEGQMSSATDLALIIKTNSETWVEIAINENDIKDISPGQTAEVKVDALSSSTLPATVQRVDEFATVISDVAVYYVYLTLDEVDQEIRPGMTAQVDILTQEKNDIFS